MSEKILAMANPMLCAVFAVAFFVLWRRETSATWIVILAATYASRAVGFFVFHFTDNPNGVAAIVTMHVFYSVSAITIVWAICARNRQSADLKTYLLISVLGLALIATTWTVNRERPERTSLSRIDLIVVMLLAIPGGFIPALFSVGVGELVALYLFIRHYPVLLCTGAACAISAVSVISGSIWHIDAGTMPWEVVVLAGPGAALGGFFARPIALWLGARRLKTLDGSWIVLSAIYLLWLMRN